MPTPSSLEHGAHAAHHKVPWLQPNLQALRLPYCCTEAKAMIGRLATQRLSWCTTLRAPGRVKTSSLRPPRQQLYKGQRQRKGPSTGMQDVFEAHHRLQTAWFTVLGQYSRPIHEPVPSCMRLLPQTKLLLHSLDHPPDSSCSS